MINTVISSITGALSKDFLYASFLPAILLMVAVGAAAGVAVGWVTVGTLIEQLTTAQTAMASTALALVGVVTAYLLSAYRGAFINFWAGDSHILLWVPTAFVRAGEWHHKRRFERLRQAANRTSHWRTTLRTFEDRARTLWQAPNRKLANKEEADAIRYQAETLSYHMTEEAAGLAIKRLADYFEAYSNIEFVFAIVKRQLVDWEEIERFRVQKNAARLDREYGGIGTIRATRLGNIIESYNYYAHKRYRVEAEVFWPRLRSVIPDEYFALVQEPKILLDFGVTMASVSAVYAFGIAVVGPWLWLNPWPWIFLGVWAIGSAIFFYDLSVTAAAQYGDMIRSCFDLYRLDLMKALQFERPKKLGVERAQWEKISQLVVYGTELDLPLAAKAADDEDT